APSDAPGPVPDGERKAHARRGASAEHREPSRARLMLHPPARDVNRASPRIPVADPESLVLRVVDRLEVVEREGPEPAVPGERHASNAVADDGSRDDITGEVPAEGDPRG